MFTYSQILSTAGQYNVKIYLANIILNSTIITVVPGSISLSNSFTYGPGVNQYGGVQDEQTYFILQAVDNYGNNLTTGGSQISISISTREIVNVSYSVIDNHDGTYEIR